MTRSPAFQPLTPSPASLITPASSLPGEKGSGGLNWYLFSMISTSGKLTLAAFPETTTSPWPGRGEGRSFTTRESGGPYFSQITAFKSRRLSRGARGEAAVDGEDAAAGVSGFLRSQE